MSYSGLNSAAPKDRNPDGLVNLCDQVIDRTDSIIARLDGLDQQLSPVLTPHGPEPANTLGSARGTVSVHQSHVHDTLQNVLLKCERMAGIISSISDRFNQ